MSEKTDKRRAKWHDTAREMRRNGFSVAVIADKFGVTRNRVTVVTSGIRSMQGRGYSRPADGCKSGRLFRVAISFTEDQVKRINQIAEREGNSFSLTVSRLIETVSHSHLPADAVYPAPLHPSLQNERDART